MKLSLKNKYKLQTVRHFIITGLIVGLFLSYVTYLTIPKEPLLPILGRGLLFGAFIGCSLGITEEWLLDNRLYNRPFWQITLIRVLIYICIIVFWLTSLNTMIISLEHGKGILQALDLYVIQGTGIQDFFFSVFAAIIVIPIFQIQKLHRKGDLLNFVLGKYNTPTEVERIFIFIDLKSSTSIAEKLGHLKYSHF